MKLSVAIDKITARHGYVFIVLFLLSFITRFIIFFPSVIGHDESTYLVIANEWLRGNVPFVDTVDIKPLGIYLVFLISTVLFGQSLVAVRLITILVIAATGYFLYRSKLAYDGDKRLAFLVGLSYVMLITFNKLGWTSNTEIFFVFFTALGLWFLQHLKNGLHYFLFGLVMGLGFIFKYHILFDTIAFGTYLLFQPKRDLMNKIGLLTIAAFGFLVPFLTILLTYNAIGHLDEFLYASFEIPSNYHHYLSFGKKMGFVGQFYVYFIPFTIAYAIAIYFYVRSHKTVLDRQHILFFLWPIIVWIAVLMTGKRFYHYYIQALLPFCFFMFDGLWQLKNPISIRYRSVVYVLLFLIILSVPMISQYKKFWSRTDSSREIAAYLKDKIEPETKIYTSQTVLYYLLDKSSPTKYIHGSLIYDKDHIKAFSIDQEEEFNRIKKYAPDYVVAYKSGKAFQVKWLASQYNLIMTCEDSVTLWKRKFPNG